MQKGYSFNSVYSFDPILNSTLGQEVQKLGESVFKKKQILVYGRPGTDRNAFKIVVEALKKWVSIQKNPESWTVLSAGEKHPPVYLGEEMYMTSVGKLSIEEYAKVLRESYAGISLMVSPHPSYPPLEMAVFDVKVITNTFRNKNISSFSENIISMENAMPSAIARQMQSICDGYHTIVKHCRTDEAYVKGTDPFPFINELKKEILTEE